MKKLFAFFLALVLAFGTAGFSSAYAATSSSKGSFSGGSKVPSTSTFGSDTTSKSYSSGKKSPSSNVTQNSPQYATPQQQQRSSLFGGGIGHFLGGMAAGALVSSLFSHMLHPFGGGDFGFSLWGLLFDALIAFVIYKLIRRLVWR